MKINLYTTYFNTQDSKRKSEFVQCILKNSMNACIDLIHLLNEGGDLSAFNSKKIRQIAVAKRPEYKDFFQLINNISEGEVINIIANTDIYFDQQIEVIKQLDLNDKCLALSRWNIQPDGSAKLFNRNDSQDVWIFKGKVKEEVFGDFPVGVPFCDNRIMYELQKAGYKVLNPSFSIKIYHLHAGKREEYNKEKLSLYVDPPYRYLYPHNLYSLPQTLWFNLTHRHKLGRYRYDLKKVNRWFITKVIRRIWEITTEREFPLIGYGKK